MKKQLFILCTLLIPILLMAQTIDEIKSDNNYLWGYGTGKNLMSADKNALKDLTSQISTSVESKYEYVITEKDGNVRETLEGIIRTYSNNTLTNALRMVNETDSGTFVLRYIKKEDLGNIFKKRETRLKGYVDNAINAENEGRIGDALRYYYWAQVLLYSHPDNQEMTYFYDGSEHQLFSWIPDRLNRIFSMLMINPTKLETDGMVQQLVFDISYQDKIAYNMDYSYWNGHDWSSLVGATNGEGIIELFGEAEKSMQEIRLKIEYEYINKSKLDPELPDVIEVIQLPYYKQAEKVIRKKSLGSNEPDAKKEEIADKTNNKKKDKIEPDKTSQCKCGAEGTIFYNLNALLDIVTGMSKKPVEPLCTKEGFEVYQRLINYGKAKLLPFDRNFKIICIGNDAVIRDIPFIFNFPANNRQFVEQLTFTFDSTGLIKNIAFSLGNLSSQGILSHSKWPEATKWQIINFLENYQTAYALERTDYIDKIFSDDALIIVGKKLEKAEPIDKMYAVLNSDQYQYIKMSKKEYIERLSAVFKSNEFVNIQFEDCEVKKRDSNSEIYGIQIAQNYFSSSYADQGYLFLMVDLTDTIKPKIYVRSWQPEKNPDGSVLGLGNFFN